MDLVASDARRAHDLLQRALGSAERAQAALQARLRYAGREPRCLQGGVTMLPCAGLQAAASRGGDVARLAARCGRCSCGHDGGAGVQSGGAAALRWPPQLRQPSGARLRTALPQGMCLQLCYVVPCAASSGLRALRLCAQVKEEGWWLVLGDAASQELHAVKRVSFAERTVTRLVIPARTAAGAPVKGVTLHLARLLMCSLCPACAGQLQGG